MFYLFTKILQFGIGLSLIIFFREKTVKDILIRVLGILILIFFTINILSLIKFIDQSFFLKNKSIENIKITPHNNYFNCSESLKDTIFIKEKSSISILKNQLYKMESIKLRQPECTKSFLIALIDNNGTEYFYSVYHTDNNGTLIYILNDDNEMGTFVENELFENLFLMTKNDFFKTK